MEPDENSTCEMAQKRFVHVAELCRILVTVCCVALQFILKCYLKLRLNRLINSFISKSINIIHIKINLITKI